VWIGSYQSVASPEVLPSGGWWSGDFYSRSAFSPGLALLLLAWGVPLMVLGDVLGRASLGVEERR
jgi:hypothetical protein